jgi:general secretion pathway protein G
MQSPAGILAEIWLMETYWSYLWLYNVGLPEISKMDPMPNFISLSASSRKSSGIVARGFTLIEIMVVVVIMGILAALIVPKLMGRTDDARIIAAKQDIATVMQALKLYKLDNQRYPTTEQGLQALVVKPTTGPAADGWKTGGYIDKLPKDPWGNPYQYLSPGIKGEIDVFSYGADGQPGGAGNDADIGSWNL